MAPTYRRDENTEFISGKILSVFESGSGEESFHHVEGRAWLIVRKHVTTCVMPRDGNMSNMAHFKSCRNFIKEIKSRMGHKIRWGFK